MDASHFEIEVRGELEKDVDPPGRRHQSAQGGRCRIVVGVDIAKRVFQLHWAVIGVRLH
jgi:hypothetical protein